MGNQKVKWTTEEEEALLAGIAKHGPGKWKNILRDPDFSHSLSNRSNIDLKDKWRNLSVSANAGLGGSKAVIVRAMMTTPPPSLPPPAVIPHDSVALVDGSPDIVMDDASNTASDGGNASRYDPLIFEALSSSKDTNGCDISAIVHFFEQRQEVPQNFRRLLGSRLRRLVLQRKVEKIQSSYRLRKDNLLASKTPTPKQKFVRPQHAQNPSKTCETVEEAAADAAYKVAEAESKSFYAAEAVKEAERVSKLAEEADSMLQLVKDIYRQCSRGEIFLLV